MPAAHARTESDGPEARPDAEAASRGRALRVHYLTMQFPAPTETFASQDVRRLRQQGVEIHVHGLRTEHPNARQMLAERELSDLHTDHNGVLPSARGAVEMLRRPGLAAGIAAWIVRRNRRDRQHLVRSLLLLPRAFDVFAGLERAKPDVVHVFWGHYPAIVARLVQRRLPDVAVSISLNAYDLEMEYAGSVDVARDADVVRTLATVNVAHVAQFAGISPERIDVIFNGVDLPRLDALMHGVRKVPRRLATVGRMLERKGMFDVLDAFVQVRRCWPDATLSVLGDGPALAEMRRRAREQGVDEAVNFEGHVSHDRVVRGLAEAEVAILLTKGSSERLPNVVKEGMACRCINVTTPTPGIEELLEHERHGFIVPPGDPDAAASTVDRIFRGSASCIEAMQERARRQIEEGFDLGATTARYVQLWDAAVARRRM